MVKNYRRKTVLFFIIVLIITMGVISSVNFDVSKNSNANFYDYSFERTYVNNNGEKLSLYQSGDFNFTYLHDEYGNILVEKNGDIFYAENANGRPQAGNVKFSNNRKLKHPTMLFNEIDFDSHPDLYLNYLPDEVEINKEPSLAKYRGTITNIVIFIRFKNENPTINAGFFNNIFNSETSSSLSGYFYEMSNGNITVNTIMPYLGSALYVYEAPNSREYYNVGGNDFRRQSREADLLANAVSAASVFLDSSGYELDIDKDDRVDSVTFMLNGSPSTSWGSLLWPHSWNLYAITQNNLSLREKSKIGGTYIGQYAFQFVDSINLGVLCHEFGHVLGAPDLYHYNNDFAPVDVFDLMHRNLNNPQYMTVYMRDKYIHSISHQIEEIDQNGYYSLPSVTSADNDDIIAYKIPTTVANEFLMVEYRSNKEVSDYDNLLPDSGLLVYRITETPTTKDKGNSDSSYQSANKPDLLYVYRPRVYSTGRETNDSVRLANSRNDLKHALLYPQNQYFSSVGTPLSNTKIYDYESLFLSNGKNTGIVIETVEMSDNSISFYVKVNPNDNVNNDYFKDKISLEDSKSVTVPYSGITSSLSLSSLDLNKLVKLSIKYKNESLETVSESIANLDKIKEQYKNGVYNYFSPFIFNSKGQILTDPFEMEVYLNEKPVFADLYIVDSDNDEVFLSRKTIDYSGISYEKLLESKNQPVPNLSSSYYLTLALDSWGKVHATGEKNNEQWAVSSYDGITKISAGYKHSLLLDKEGKVYSIGSNVYGEGSFNVKNPIMDIAAGYFNSYLLDVYGKVYAYGDNAYNQLLINGTANIKSLFAGEKNVIAIKNDGTIIGYGDNTYGQLNFSSTLKAKEVAVGLTFLAVLTEDNEVKIFGELKNKDLLNNRKFVKISASNDNLALICPDLTPIVLGNNSYNQTDTEGLIDIIDVSCGKFSIAYLRKDGEVEFKGSGDDFYGTNTVMPNLNYKEEEYKNLTDFSHTSIAELKSNDTYKINLTFIPSYATYKEVAFSSSNNDVATVSLDGLITAKANGQTTITITPKSNPLLKKSFTLKVFKKINIVGITFIDSNIEIIKDAEINLVVLLNPIDANEEHYIEFATSDPSVVKIDKEGKIYGIGYGVANITANVTVKETGYKFTCAVTVTVISEITGIYFKNSQPKTEYLYGESLKLDDLTLYISRIDGEEIITSVKNVTEDMIYNFDKYKIDSQIITIRYLDKTIELTITVSNYIVEIKLTDEFPTTQVFFAEDKFDVGENAKLLEIYANGYINAVPLANGMVSGYDALKIGLQLLTVTYRNFETSYYAEVKDKVVGISLDTNEKLLNYGEKLTENQLLKILMFSGDIRYTKLQDDNVLYFDSNLLGRRQVTISYHDEISGLDFLYYFYVSVILEEGIIEVTPNKNLYYFVLGKNPIFGVSYKTDKKTYEVLQDGNFYYAIDGLNNQSTEKQVVTINLYAKNYNGGETLISYDEIFVKGYPAFTNYIIESLDNEFNFQETVSIENPNKIRIKIDEGGVFRYLTDNEITLDFNLEILNEVQVMTVNYCDNIFNVKVLIRDNPTAIKEISEISIYLYDVIFFDVYLIMQSGNTSLANDNYLEFIYDNTVLGNQTATIKYLKLGDKGEIFEFEKQFSLNILDKEISIKAVVEIKTEYKYLEKINLASKYSVNYLSDKVVNIDFNLDTFAVSLNTENLPVGAYNLKITYLPLNYSFNYTIIISNYCVKLTFENDAVFLYQKLDKPSINLNALMADGQTLKITSAHTSNNFNSNSIGKFEFTFTYLDCSVKGTFEIVLNVEKLTFSSLPSKIYYGYGESLNLNGAVLKVNTTDNQSFNLIGNEIKNYITNYNPMISGTQQVNVKVGFIAVGFNVTISSDINLLKVINNKKIFVDNKNKIVSLQEEISIKDLIGNFSRANYLVYVIEKDIELNAGSFDKIKLKNSDGDIVAEYTIYLKGDGNGDGVVDKEDLDFLAKLYVSNKILEILDINGDKKVTLADIVYFSLKINDKVPPSSQEFFKNLICDIKREEL